MTATHRWRIGALILAAILAGSPSLALGESAIAVPTPSAGHSAIFGIVTPDAGGTFAGTIRAELKWTDGTNFTTWGDDADGNGYFEINNLPSTGTATLIFYYSGSAGWATTGWAPPGGSEGSSFGLTAGQVIEANGPLHRGGVISGTVSSPPDAPLVTPYVYVYGANSALVASAVPDSDGHYAVVGLRPGVYRVEFASQGLVVGEYWSDKSSLATSDPLTVDYGQTISGIDAELATVTAITGVVSYDLPGGGTAPLADAKVTLLRLQDYGTWTTYTDSDGRYVLYTSPGQLTFVLGYMPPPGQNLVSEYWEDTVDFSSATPMSVADGQLMTGMDVTLAQAASVTGRIRYDLGTPQDLDGADVRIYRSGPSGYALWDLTASGSDGTFALSHLPAGDYALKVVDTSPKKLGVEYWQDATSLQDATTITLAAGEARALGDIVLVGDSISTDRLAGSDRFATGVAVTRRQFPEPAPDVPVVYIANGLNYPDALTAGPAAIQGHGALLLVNPDNIPNSVADELERLQPHRIVIVGGLGAISASVETQLHAYSSTVDRLAGSDRFETSELVVRDAFRGGAVTAFFATGLNFPDALAAGPAAGANGAPIILVNGGDPGLDSRTIDLMHDLGVSNAYVVGGTGSVSAGVANDVMANLTKIGPFDSTSYGRLAGSDRYRTAVEVNRMMFVESDTALLATGTGFADALAGGPLAGAMGIPMYLSEPDCVPDVVIGGMSDLEITSVWLLGGTGTLSSAVEAMGGCA